MYNAEMKRGNEIPTQHLSYLDDWEKSRKKKPVVGRHRYFNLRLPVWYHSAISLREV